MKPESFRDLLRLAHGFEMAKVFFVANDLDLFRRLGEGREAESLAAELEVDGRALSLLLNALTALGLLRKEGAVYRNGPAAEAFLSGDDRYCGSIFKHIHHCWDAWSGLAETLRRGGPAAPAEDALLGEREAWTRDFIRGMDDVTRELAPQVVRQLDLPGARVLLDVGGGPGTYAAAFLAAHPGLREVRIFDLPAALEVGRERLAAAGCLERVRLVPGDFHQDGLGSGADVVWISQVLHSQDEAGCRMLIDKAWHALNPGGLLAVHEFLLDETGTAPLGAALFAVHMLVMTEGGRSYGGAELVGWMAERGFDAPVVRKVSEETGVALARKPRHDVA